MVVDIDSDIDNLWIIWRCEISMLWVDIGGSFSGRITFVGLWWDVVVGCCGGMLWWDVVVVWEGV